MPIHDAYARRTPLELAFPDRETARKALEAIDEEVRKRGSDVRDPAGFVMLGEVGRTLQALRPADSDPEAIHQHGALLFHAWRFRREGGRVYLLTTHALRYLVDADPGADDGEGAWPPGVPAAAGYLQLPQHLVWSRADADETPESVDGILWSRSGGGTLHAMVVTGIRGDRPGFGAVPLPAAPLDDAAEWLETGMREGNGDFASEMPGAELEGLYEIRTAGEALKLLARFFWYVDRVPGAVIRREPPAEDPSPEAADPGAPEPSAMSYHEVGLG